MVNRIFKYISMIEFFRPMSGKLWNITEPGNIRQKRETDLTVIVVVVVPMDFLTIFRCQVCLLRSSNSTFVLVVRKHICIQLKL